MATNDRRATNIYCIIVIIFCRLLSSDPLKTINDQAVLRGRSHITLLAEGLFSNDDGSVILAQYV